MTSVFTIVALWLVGLCCVIGLAISEEQVGLADVSRSAWWGVDEVGHVQNYSIDDKFMQNCVVVGDVLEPIQWKYDVSSITRLKVKRFVN